MNNAENASAQTDEGYYEQTLQKENYCYDSNRDADDFHITTQIVTQTIFRKRLRTVNCTAQLCCWTEGWTSALKTVME